jgi:hypothetical protein
MRVLSVGLFLAVIGILSGLVQDVRDAQAIPAFARKYDFACSVCHVPSFPKLNDFGNLFRDHGYQLGIDQEIPTWEGLTKGYWPVSFRTTVGYQAQSRGGLLNATSGVGDVTASTGSFGFTGLDILSLGILARDISFGMVYTPGLGSAGFNAGSTAGAGDLESAFIKLDNVQRFIGLGDNNYLMNFKVGKYELDLPFSEKRSPTLNTPFLAYHYNAGTPMIGGGLAGIANPNDFGLGDNHGGIELAGIAPTSLTNGYFRYSLNAISNSDVNTGGAGGGRVAQFYGHVTQSFDGYGVVSGQRLGAYAMYGKVPTFPNAAGLAPGTGEDGKSFSRVGVDASLTWGGQVNVFGTWMFARDSRDMFVNNGVVPTLTSGTIQDAKWNGGFMELDYNPIQFQKWLLIYRYDWITNTQQADNSFSLPNGNLAGNFNNTRQHTAGIRYNFHVSSRTDVALHLEFSHLTGKFTAASGGDQVQDTGLIGFDFAL